MTRRIYVARPDEPDAAQTAAAMRASEVWMSLTPRLKAAGVGYGFTELVEPPPTPPAPDPRAELLDRIGQATMLDEIREIVADAIGGGVL